MRYILREQIYGNLIEILEQKQVKINKSNINIWKLSKKLINTIKGKLRKSQKNICCYCECELNGKNEHIEHFFERNDFIDKIYLYENMLLSCDGDKNIVNNYDNNIHNKLNISCGNYKSASYHNQEKINYKLLLNPSKTNTSLLFNYYDGYISPKKNISNKEQQQVKFTIKRLNLDSEKMNTRRLNKIKEINNQIKDLNKAEKIIFLKHLLNENKEKLTPYFSTIKDNFSFLIDE